jgi:shikimate dehydrogenase
MKKIEQPLHLGLIGQSISHSDSPRLHTRLGHHLGYQVSFDLIDCDPFMLDSLFTGQNLKSYLGLNVTTPYKERLYHMVDRLTDTAKLIGAVNTLKYEESKLIGHNTDDVGVTSTLAMLASLGHTLGSHAVIIGVGPASRSAAYALIQAGVQSITWIGRNSKRGERCLAWCAKYFPQLRSTWVSTEGQLLGPALFKESISHLISGAPPLMCEDWVRLSETLQAVLGENFGLLTNGIFIDLNYGELRTHGSRQYCQSRQRAHRDGSDMLIGQGVASFKWWTGSNVSWQEVYIHLKNT